MKKLLALILSLALAVSFAACSAGGGYTPSYGERLVLNDNLKFKSEYKKAISPETRDMISNYMVQMVSAYNSIDPDEEQMMGFTYIPYYFTNRFYQEISPAVSGVAIKNAMEEELTEREQLFWDMITLLEELPNKYSDIERAMFYPEEEETEAPEAEEPEETDRTADTRPETTDEEGEVPEGEEENEGEGDEVTTAKIDRAMWEDLFNLYVEIMNTFYTDPFVQP